MYEVFKVKVCRNGYIVSNKPNKQATEVQEVAVAGNLEKVIQMMLDDQIRKDLLNQPERIIDHDKEVE